MYNRLLRNVRKAGCNAHVMTGNGMKMLVLQEGGRILGLWPEDSEENFFWINPRIFDEPESLWKEKWPNPGGDRCWLSPICVIQTRRSSGHLKYHVPCGVVDSGRYHVCNCRDGSLRLCAVGGVRMRKKHDTFALERFLSWTANPLRYVEENWAGKLSYAGYSQRINLESLSCIENKLSAWTILQLPIGGEIIIPVYGGNSLLRHTLEMKNTDTLKFLDGRIQLRTDGEKDFMISIPPHMSTGRIGYVRETGKDWTLVVRSLYVNPSDEYLNCFSRSSGKPGHAVQCRIVSDGKSSHVELHSHLPCNGRIDINGIVQTWCFRGNKKYILRATAFLTGYERFFVN